MIYKDEKRNYVVWEGREAALKKYLNAIAPGIGKHKLKHRFNSHSEDALTWSCFDTLSQLSNTAQQRAIEEIWEDAFKGRELPKELQNEVTIHVGKRYDPTSKEGTEVDASFETAGALVFIEAKLYSSISLADPKKPFDQIARKLRVGLIEAHRTERDFYFIWLDVAPLEKLYKEMPIVEAKASRSGFHEKWRSAYFFRRYKINKGSVSPTLKEVLEGIPGADPAVVAKRMGWLTWTDLYKIVLRAVIKDRVEVKDKNGFY